MKLIDWINKVTKLNQTTLTEFQNNIEAGKQDKMKEGTWTPSINTVENKAPTITYTTQVGKYERIGEKEAFLTHKIEGTGKKIKIENPAYNHTEAIEFTLEQLVNPEYKVIDSLDEITAIGHRLVHGGEKIAESVKIDDNVVEVLKEYAYKMLKDTGHEEISFHRCPCHIQWSPGQPESALSPLFQQETRLLLRAAP